MIEINKKTDMLLIVDFQTDFITGSLTIKNAEELVPIINKYIKKIKRHAVSRDWHPAIHSSFVEQGGPWPPHCVAGTEGAEIHPNLNIKRSKTLLINKGISEETDQYSALDGTGFEIILPDIGVKRLFICGLATDYCVKATVLDALKIIDIEVYLLVDGIKAVNEGDGDKAIEEMVKAGVIPVVFDEIK